MAVAEITATWSGHILGRATGSYTDARNTVYTNSAGNPYVGQSYLSGTDRYYVYRAFLVFDTSSLSGETVTQVNLRLTAALDYSDTDYDVQIVKQDWSSYDPISTGNREAAYDACLAGTADNNIWRNTSGIATNTPYESGNLDTAWVNTTGNTYYSLRSSRDFANQSPSGREDNLLGGYVHVTAAYRPILVVTYGEAPTASTPIHLIRTGMQPGMRIGL